ncbi:hypothetical protein N5D61_05130 [Pseudomonas sp. GD03842]|uniref:hypothetical protein n=1 Tax=Pseudomonas sp. GD03842 TaxID=2975385 RepID=UPI00244CBF8F|nr:hypothetical protein [Pseudomonas sp. GD03842]MDH0745303.1 hypothetical protein [Pseudomonas sp. GD03842]MDH0745722.1 hypothetical protein [Pseudomonas sp. GD03842]
MAYGMRIWGADGALQLDENSFTMRIAASYLVTFSGSAKQSQVFSAAGCNQQNAVAVMVPIGVYNSTARQHKAVLNNDGTVTVYNYLTENPAINNVSTGTMRLMVVRFK